MGVKKLIISLQQDGQRLDNVLMALMRSVPRSIIYKLVRTGQVRINGKRCKPMTRVTLGDELRLPPVTVRERDDATVPARIRESVKQWVLHDDDDYLVLDKPPGLAVHSGSGLSWGLIDAVRQAFGDETIELAHRLDRDTSGCLVMTRNPDALRRFQSALRENRLQKSYQALLMGTPQQTQMRIEMPLLKSQVRGGERMVVVSPDGKPAVSVFEILETYPEASLVGIKLETGRTHQIRVHAVASGHPVAGDPKYGDKAFNRKMQEQGLKRLFLHAQRIDLPYPGGELLPVHAPLPEDLQQVLEKL